MYIISTFTLGIQKCKILSVLLADTFIIAQLNRMRFLSKNLSVQKHFT